MRKPWHIFYGWWLVGLTVFTMALIMGPLFQGLGAFIFAVLFGIGFDGRVPLLIAIRGDYFGRRAFATIMGVSSVPMNLIMMGAPVAAGYLFDTMGSYTVSFLGLAVLTVVGPLVILIARKLTLPASRHQHQTPYSGEQP